MRAFLVFLTVIGLCHAQQPQAPATPGASPLTVKSAATGDTDYDPFFPKASYFRRHFSSVPPKAELLPPTRLADFVVDGKLELSLRSYLELVMANNPDVSIQTLSVEVNRNAITRAFAGFDPVATASFNASRSQQPTSDTLAGAAVLSTLSQPLNLNYTQLFQAGTQLTLNFNGTRTSNNNSFAIFNPNVVSRFNVGFSQPLLRNRGMYVNRLPIMIARSRLKQAGFSLEDSIIQLIATAEGAYWNVIEARENLRVAEENLKLNGEALKRAQRELELGATSPLDIFQPQAVYANAEIQLTQARYRLAQTEDALRRQIGADVDPQVRTLPIVLTEPVAPPTGTASYDREALVGQAIQRRPDLRAASQALDVDELNLKSAVNGLRPLFSLTGGYGSFGRGGNFIRPNGTIPGGVADSLDQVFSFTYPAYSFGLNLTLPIRDRNAAANLADAKVNRKLDQLRVRSTEQNIRLQVLTAISLVDQSKASVELAKVARDLAQKRVEAEQKKYELGTTTIFFVLSAQGDLTNAESALVRESINFRRNQISLLQRVGSLLDERGIRVQ